MPAFNRQNKGFTLIELVIVIVLLGILAATALPKFANLTTQARLSAARGVAGGISAAVSISRAQWLAVGQTASITLADGPTTVVMSANGWPECSTCTANGIATAAKCLEVWNALLNSPPLAGTSCTGNCQYLVQVTASPTCQFLDQQGGAGANVITYNISTGAVVAP